MDQTKQITEIESKDLMAPVKGTMREGLHAALDDLMDDIEQRPEASSGGMTGLTCDAPPYRHVIQLAVYIETVPLDNPTPSHTLTFEKGDKYGLGGRDK